MVSNSPSIFATSTVSMTNRPFCTSEQSVLRELGELIIQLLLCKGS